MRLHLLLPPLLPLLALAYFRLLTLAFRIPLAQHLSHSLSVISRYSLAYSSDRCDSTCCSHRCCH